jgi:hypothetical protein
MSMRMRELWRDDPALVIMIWILRYLTAASRSSRRDVGCVAERLTFLTPEEAEAAKAKAA